MFLLSVRSAQIAIEFDNVCIFEGSTETPQFHFDAIPMLFGHLPLIVISYTCR